MKRAGDFLSRFQKLTPPNDALRRAVASAVSATVGVRVEKGQVRIQNAVAFVDISNTAKHSMRTKRSEILELIQEKLPRGRDLVRDVR